MTGILPQVYGPQPDQDRLLEQIRRLQVQQPPTLRGCTDEQFEAERQRREERRAQQLKDAIKLVEGAGYTVVKGSGG